MAWHWHRPIALLPITSLLYELEFEPFYCFSLNSNILANTTLTHTRMLHIYCITTRRIHTSIVCIIIRLVCLFALALLSMWVNVDRLVASCINSTLFILLLTNLSKLRTSISFSVDYYSTSCHPRSIDNWRMTGHDDDVRLAFVVDCRQTNNNNNNQNVGNGDGHHHCHTWWWPTNSTSRPVYFITRSYIGLLTGEHTPI